MICEISKLKDFYSIVDKEIVPSQLSPFYAKLIDSDIDTCYTIYLKNNNIVREQLNFVLMKRPYGTFLISMPFIGYGSCLNIKNKKHLKELFLKLESFATENGCLSMSICNHPLSNINPGDMRHFFDYSFSHNTICQISTLNVHPLKTLSHKRRSAFKNEISKSVKAGFSVVKKPDRDMFNSWYDVYVSRFDDIDAVPNSKKFYLGLYRESVRNQDVEFWVAKDSDVVIGGMFFEKGKGIVDYTTSAFLTVYHKFYPTTFVLDEYFSDNIDVFRYFNWQGSGNNSGVFNYKRRWGAVCYDQFYYAKNLVPVENITSIPLDRVKSDLFRCFILPYSLWEGC